ncbi:hypothetical protein C8R44DRAFT_989486 [Mycena epipterygia]|nr:hypothetical protein C8R44DRAFT_989486 [Mycena epipterygia]
MSENLSQSYLFLCPLEDLRCENGTWSRNPDCLAYWSLDPLGRQRLDREEASSLGFPALKLEINVSGYSWDESIYAALSYFHAGKGFDPNGQDVARHLGLPLYELSPSLQDDSARIEELYSDSI